MNINSTSSTDPSHGDQTGTPPAHGANSQSQGDKSPTKQPTLEELQAQLAASEAEKNKFLADNLKYREKQREQAEAAKAKEALDKAAE
ncbi:MAG TPA: hypothetical protein VHV10_16970, partial [Ktedonobacteraceae bacterium]|nr:hypothetical protein [Ktedonobacteraceae bacterium]